MGYRNSLYFMDKKVFNKIRKMNKDQLWDFIGKEKAYSEEELKSVPSFYKLKDIGVLEEAFEFGKYYDCDVSKCLKPFFKDKEIHRYYNQDGEFMLAKFEIFECLLEDFRNRVLNYYKNLVEDIPDEYDTRSHYDRLLRDARDHLMWAPYLGRPEKKFSLGGGWLYEHEIFNLTYVMKLFNLKKQVLIWIGG